MNFFVEGLQGSGKSTLVNKLSEIFPDYRAVREGDYSPVELAWCAYVRTDQYRDILERYETIRPLIEEKSFEDNGKMVICYTKIATDIPGFYRDLEQYEIYNHRKEYDEFKNIILGRYSRWNGNNHIFECSLFQNIVEEMILFRTSTDEEILDLYKEIRAALTGKDLRILYLKADDIASNIQVIRKERSDENGNELWFPMLLGFFNESPYAKKTGKMGEEALLQHLKHRQELELRICREIFPDQYTVLPSKGYSEQALLL